MWYRVNTDDEHAMDNTEPSVGDQSADGASNGSRLADGPVDEAPADDPVDDLPAGDGGGMSPVVREYVEGLRREALARDAELRARGIDPYKGTGVDEGPRHRLGARALAVLVVLVAAVSVVWRWLLCSCFVLWVG